jgi:site-specific recombinase XerD
MKTRSHRRQTAVQTVTPDEFSLMLCSVKWGPSHPSLRKRWCWQRNRLLLLLLWGSGIRISELLGLRYMDIEAGEIRVHHGKGNVGRTIGYTKECDLDFRAWQGMSRDLGREEGDYLLTVYDSDGKDRWCRQGAAKAVARIGKFAGIRRRIGPHLLRHSMALQMMREGSDIVTIQRQLGHANAGMTGEYLNGLDNESHVTAVRERETYVQKKREEPGALNHLVEVQTLGY